MGGGFSEPGISDLSLGSWDSSLDVLNTSSLVPLPIHSVSPTTFDVAALDDTPSDVSYLRSTQSSLLRSLSDISEEFSSVPPCPRHSRSQSREGSAASRRRRFQTPRR